MSDSSARKLPVDEYHRGRKIQVIEWDSLTECAVHHGVKQKTIKTLIHFGGTLKDGKTTFDIPCSCPLETREVANHVIEIYDERTGLVLDGGSSTKQKIIGEHTRS